MKMLEQFVLFTSCLLFPWIQTFATDQGPRACVANVNGSGIYSVSTFDVPSRNKIGLDASSGVFNHNIAITPDGKQAWLGDFANSPFFYLSVFNIGKDEVENTVQVLDPSAGIAITPDGKEVWSVSQSYSAAGRITVIDAKTLQKKNDIPTTTGFSCAAITPDGKEAWFGLTPGTDPVPPHGIAVYDTQLKSFKQNISIGVLGDTFVAIAMTPDNQTAFACGTGGAVYVVDVASHSVQTTIPSILSAVAIAVAPNNKYLCIGDASNGLFFVDRTTFLTTVSINLGATITGIAITPDSSEVWVTLDNSTLVILDPTTASIKDTISLNGRPTCISITPDQAPTAKFMVKSHHKSISLDASSSSSPFGAIAQYAWNFGDGSPNVITNSPLTSHTFKKPGVYAVTLTVTNTSGTSTEQTFTGQVVGNNGSSSAQRTDYVTVDAPMGARKFNGKVKKHHAKVRVKTTWQQSSSDDVRQYDIFVGHTKVASVPAKTHRKNLYLRPYELVGKKIRVYAVSSKGLKSRPTLLQIIR